MNKLFYRVGLCILFVTSLNADVITRASVDIGSGETKLTVADVDTDLNQIVLIRYQNHQSVELKKNLAESSNGCLDKTIEDKLISTLKNMQAEVSLYAPKQWFGVGTSVFRTAKNGQDVLDRVKAETNISIQLVPQAVEGEIGFFSAVAASKLLPIDVIAWDSGAGSFQISTLIDGQIEVYGSEFAYVPALEALFAIRGKPFSQNVSPNPVSLAEAYDLVMSIEECLPPVPQWLIEHNKHVITFGGQTSIFKIGMTATGRTTYTKSQVWEAILQLAGKTSAQLSNFAKPDEAVVALILLFSVMDHCAIDRVSYFDANGGCEGILIIPRFWQ